MQPDQLLEPAPSTIDHALPQTHRACPYCAEAVLVAAVICKHCRSKIGPKPPKLPTLLRIGVLFFRLFAISSIVVEIAQLIMLSEESPQIVPICISGIAFDCVILWLARGAARNKEWALWWMMLIGIPTWRFVSLQAVIAIMNNPDNIDNASVVLARATLAGIGYWSVVAYMFLGKPVVINRPLFKVPTLPFKIFAIVTILGAIGIIVGICAGYR